MAVRRRVVIYLGSPIITSLRISYRGLYLVTPNILQITHTPASSPTCHGFDLTDCFDDKCLFLHGVYELVKAPMIPG